MAVELAGAEAVERGVALGLAGRALALVNGAGLAAVGEPVGSGALLLERGSEVALIDALLARVLGGEARRLLIEGPAGIGQSALLEYLGNRARRRGIELRVCQCSQSDARVALGAARALLGDGAEPAVRADGDVIVAGLLRAALELARSVPLVFAVDHAQWADQESLRFLSGLAGRRAGVRVAIVLAVRSEADAGRGRALRDRLDDRHATRRVKRWIGRPATANRNHPNVTATRVSRHHQRDHVAPANVTLHQHDHDDRQRSVTAGVSMREA